MRRTSLAEIRTALDALAMPRDHVYVVHSSLLKFGVIEGGLPGVMAMLRDALGAKATILMPTFSFAYGRSRVWDYHATRAETGALCEHFRKLPGVLRTIHPFHSLAVEGPLAERFAACDNLSSFGPGSPFELLYQMEAVNLSLGCELEGGATFLHHAEELAAVPYRFYKDFPGEVRDAQGSLLDRTFRMYVREIGDTYYWDNRWEHVWQDFLDDGSVAPQKVGGATLFAFNIPQAHDRFFARLKADPYYCAIRCENKD